MTSKNSEWIVRRTPRDRAALRLFCFPHAGAGSVIFREWPADFPGDIDVCLVEPPGRLARRNDRAIGDVIEFARILDAELDPYLDVPFAFFGYSLGSLMAFECARQIRRSRKLQPSHLFVAAHKAPQSPRRQPPISREPRLTFVRELERRYGPFEPIIKADPEMFDAVVSIMRVDLGMVEAYDYAPEAPFDCPITAIGGTDDASLTSAELEAWREQTTAAFRPEWLAGGHFFLRNRGAQLRALVRDQLVPEASAKRTA